MIIAGKLAKIGNKILNIIATVVILLLMLYGTFSLWDTYRLYHSSLPNSEILKYKPKGDKTQNKMTLEELIKINSDVVGWITVDDTHIDYPLVQGQEILEYINKDVFGNFSLAGSIFLDTRNKPDFSDPYTLTYGHHIANGGMYGDVVEFENKEFFDKHQTGKLYYKDGTVKKFTIFACVTTHANDPVIFNPTMSGSDNSVLLQEINSKAVQKRDVNATRHIIGLSTCEDASTNGRTIVYGYIED